jgi:hypothetical protein
MTISESLDAMTGGLTAKFVTDHASRLIRMSLTYRETPQGAAKRALEYVVQQCGAVDPGVVAKLARELLGEAEREAAIQKEMRS